MIIKVVVRTAFQLLGAEVAEWKIWAHIDSHACALLQIEFGYDHGLSICQLAASPQPEIDVDS